MWQHVVAETPEDRARIESEIKRVEADLLLVLSLLELDESRLHHTQNLERINTYRTALARYALMRDHLVFPLSSTGGPGAAAEHIAQEGSLTASIYAALEAIGELRQGYVEALEAEWQAREDQNHRGHVAVVITTLVGATLLAAA